MVDYIIGVLPPIKFLKAAYPDVTHIWYADTAGAFVTFYNIWSYFNALNHFRPGYKYYPKYLKSVLIMHPNKLAAGKNWFSSQF